MGLVSQSYKFIVIENCLVPFAITYYPQQRKKENLMPSAMLSYIQILFRSDISHSLVLLKRHHLHCSYCNLQWSVSSLHKYWHLIHIWNGETASFRLFLFSSPYICCPLHISHWISKLDRFKPPRLLCPQLRVFQFFILLRVRVFILPDLWWHLGFSISSSDFRLRFLLCNDFDGHILGEEGLQFAYQLFDANTDWTSSSVDSGYRRRFALFRPSEAFHVACC